ncbi:hypothetical protein M153_139030002, partial [Pseudoloma neurophilia]
RKMTPPIFQYIDDMLSEDASYTLAFMSQKIFEKFNIRLSTSTIDRSLTNLHFSLKTLTPVPIGRNYEVTIQKRRIFEREFTFLNYVTNSSDFAFIDEVSFSLTTRVLKGRLRIGQSAYKSVRNIRSRKFSIIAAVTNQQPIFFKNNISSVNGSDFAEFVIDLKVECARICIKNQIFIYIMHLVTDQRLCRSS